MTDTAQASSAIVQSSRLLELSPELQDMILTEYYKKIVLTGTNSCPWDHVNGWLCLEIERTCKRLRQRALAVRAMLFDRTLVVRDCESFVALSRSGELDAKYAWLCRALASVEIECVNEYPCFPFHWDILLKSCPKLSKVDLLSEYNYRSPTAQLQAYLPLDLEENKRKLARAVIAGGFSMGSYTATPSWVLQDLGHDRRRSVKDRDLRSEAVVRTMITDQDGKTICEVV